MINGVKVFDTILDKSNDTVSRNSADFWKPFCKSASWSFSYERVHSLHDLEYFFSKKIKEKVIIFSGHGNENGFSLSNGDCFDAKSLKAISKKNKDKIIIFSSCLIGKNAKLCDEFKSYFSAQLLFAYRHSMHDRFCFLYESILLTYIEHKLEKKESFTLNDFIDFECDTEFMKNMNSKHAKLHPLIMV